MLSGATLEVGGTLALDNTGSSSYWNTGAGGGTVHVLSGGLVTRTTLGEKGFYPWLDNDGGIAPSAGTLTWSNGLTGTSTGSFGGVGLVKIDGGTGTISGAAQITGRLQFGNGNTALGGTVTGTPQSDVTVLGGAVSGSGGFDVAKLSIMGGTFAAAGLTSTADLTVSGYPDITTGTVRLKSGGIGRWDGAGSSVPRILNGGTIEIAGTMTFDNTGSSSSWSAGTGGGSIHVASGGVLKRTTPGAASIGVTVDNDGTLDVVSGTELYLYGGGGDSTGSYTGAGTTRYTGGQATLRDATVSGTLRIDGATVTMAGVTHVTGALQQTGGTLAGLGEIDVPAPGQFALSGGVHGGGGITRIGPGATGSLGGYPQLRGRTLVNEGTLNWTGSSASVPQLGDAARIDNAGTLVLDNSSGSSSWSADDRASQLRNEGTLDVRRGVSLNLHVVNDGLLKLSAGTVGVSRFTQSADGTVQTTLRGTTPGTDFATLSVYELNLLGRLKVLLSAFTPSSGQTFRLIQGTRDGSELSSVDAPATLSVVHDDFGVLATGTQAAGRAAGEPSARAVPPAAPAGGDGPAATTAAVAGNPGRMTPAPTTQDRRQAVRQVVLRQQRRAAARHAAAVRRARAARRAAQQRRRAAAQRRTRHLRGRS